MGALRTLNSVVLVCLLSLQAQAAPANVGFKSNQGALAISPKAPLNIEKNPPIVMQAREMGFDEKSNVVVAIGNVEVVQGAYVLTADQLTYFKNRNLVVAEGNVTLLQPTGDVFFSDRAELRDDMKQGVILAFKARMADNSVLVADRATKVSPSVTKLNDARYTPCNLCEGMAPFWQLSASEVKLDEIKERIEYDDVDMQVFGVPVFYTPTLSHPTPDAQAKSGFLTPTFATNGNIGSFAQAPYYWRIDHDKEAIITPWFTSDVGTLLHAQYQQLTDHGNYSAIVSATNPPKIDALGNEVSGNEFRGHIFAQGLEQLTPETSVGFNINRATDDTYLRRYNFGAQRSLFSRAFVETARGRNFGLAQTIAIQGLQLGDEARRTPLILPAFQGYYETPKDANGIRYHLSGDAQALTRELGADQRRFSLTGGASLPLVTEDGHIFTSTLNLRQDVYNSNDVAIAGSNNTLAGTTYRTIPQAALEWRYPLINRFDGGAVTVEPLLLGVAQPTNGNPQGISNEDNQLIALSDTNLFSLNRMPGLDTVDSGSRLAYGFRAQYLMNNGAAIDALFGQNYNFYDETPFPNSVTPGENFSDYIGRIGLSVAPYNLAYRFSLKQDDLQTTRNEFTFGYARPWLSFQTSYRSLDDNQFITTSEELQFDGAMPIDDAWSLYGGARRDLIQDRMVNANGGIIFRNECFNFALDALRIYARDRDLEPNTQVTFRIGFKNLGEFGGN